MRERKKKSGLLLGREMEGGDKRGERKERIDESGIFF